MSGKCTECSSITLFKGSDGRTIYNGSGAPTLTTANAGDFYIDTDTWEIYGPFTTSGGWGTGTSLIGPQGQGVDHISLVPGPPGGNTYELWADAGETISLGTFFAANGTDGNDGVGIASIVWTSNSGGQPQFTQGTIDTYTITYTDASTDTIGTYNGADGTNASALYENVAWVDKSNGNDGTGTVGRFDLPYQTIAGARAAVISGQTVWIRPNTYVESLILKDGVTFYADAGVTLVGQITDNAVALTSKVSGLMKIVYGGNNAVDLTAPLSDIHVECDEIVSTGTTIHTLPGLGKEGHLYVKCRKLVATNINYNVALRGDVDVTVEITEVIESASVTGGFNSINLRDFGGRLHLSCPKVIIGDSTNAQAGVFLNEESSVRSGAYCHIEVNEIINNYTYASADNKGLITKSGSGTLILDITRATSDIRGVIVCNSGEGADGLTIFEGHASSNQRPVVRHGGEQPIVIRNSSLHRGNGGVDENQVIVIGNAGGATALPGGVTDNIKLEVINTQILKTSGGDVVTGAIVAKQGANTVLMFKDCDILGLGTFTGEACDVDNTTTTEPDIYFKNTTSNVDNNIDVNDSSVGGGFTGNDLVLTTYDYID